MKGIKDFNILGLKVTTSSTKKDISLVSDYNAYSQKIEHVCRTQKGELAADISIGSNYFAFIFDPIGNKDVTEMNLEAYIKSAIDDLSKVKVTILYSDQEKILLNVNFSLKKYTQDQSSACLVEVNLQ